MSLAKVLEASMKDVEELNPSTGDLSVANVEEFPVARRTKRNYSTRALPMAENDHTPSISSATTHPIDGQSDNDDEICSPSKRVIPLTSAPSDPEAVEVSDSEYCPPSDSRQKRKTSKRSYATEVPLPARPTPKKPAKVAKAPFCDPSLVVPYEEPASPPYTSSLSGVSLDVARLIWSFLDVDSLALLHCTFNRSVQRLMHSRGAIAQAVLEYGTSIQIWQIRYFLLSLHDVDMLHLDHVSWKPALLARLLRSANPYELVLGKSLLPSSLLEELKDTSECTEETQAALKCFTPSAIPDFALLTPQLKSLKFKFGINSLSEPRVTRFRSKIGRIRQRPKTADALSLPPTLESLALGALGAPDLNLVIPKIPETIGTLDVQLRDTYSLGSVLKLVFARFKYLQTFNGGSGAIYGDNPQFELPSHIESLSMGPFQYYPLALLEHPSFRMSHLKTLKMGISPSIALTAASPNMPSDGVDFASSLPKTLESLDLSISPNSRPECRLVDIRLPTFITSLTLKFDTSQVPPLILGSLSSLTTLQDLSLKLSDRQAQLSLSTESPTPADNRTLFSFSMLPSKLLRFTLLGTICATELRKDLIPELPQSLVSVTVASSDLAWALEFRNRLPNASITLSKPIDAWNSQPDATLRNEFPECWRETYDNVAYEQAIKQKYHAQKIFLTCEWNSCSLTTNKNAHVTTFIFSAPQSDSGNMSPFFPRDSYQFLKTMPNLQKLVIKLHPNTHGALWSTHLPNTLTHLELLNVDLAYSGTSKVHLLPPQLAFLKSDCPFDTGKRLLSFKHFPALRYLDTPWWNWRISSLGTWTDAGMDKLAAHLSGLKDTQWVDFLKTTFHPKTLSNMYVSISYTHTGHLLSLKESKQLLGHSLVEKRQATQYRLTDNLQQTMVPFASTSTPGTFVNRPLGHVVFEMHVDEKESRFFEG